jgi:excisionase family DNA binding protein
VNLISVSEAAKEKGVSREAVYQAIRRGELDARRVLGRIGVQRRSLDAYRPDAAKVRAGRERAARAAALAPLGSITTVTTGSISSQARGGD